MTFEEWWYDNQDELIGEYSIAEAAWYAAWDQQQRVIDEMHLMFRGKVLVPKEPTEAILKALWINKYEHITDIYAALIQASGGYNEQPNIN